MLTHMRSLAAITLLTTGLCLALPSSLSAGTYKHITIDGSFADWAGVPVAASDDEGDTVAGTMGGFDLKEVYVANDDNYIYLRVVIYPSSSNPNYGSFHHHFYIDSDNDPVTGRAAYGIGSEMLLEDAGGYSQRYGTWNDGTMTGLDWAQSPAGALPTYQYEARISRALRDVQPADVPAGSGNPERDFPLFTQAAIAMAFEVQDSNWAITDNGSAFQYEIASTPAPFTGTETLLALTSSNWRVSDAGTDLGSEWLAAGYDDTQSGWQAGTGLFGFNAPSGVYPAAVATTLNSGKSAYYFRARFNWNYDQNGAGLLVSNYLSAGAVFYLNGAEVQRLRMPEGAVSYSTPATGGPAQPGSAEMFDLPSTALVVGENILEVEVHPAAGATSSMVFGLSLIASDNFPPRVVDPTQPADRNVTEGQATTFSAGALAGTSPFTYQWLKDGTPIEGATGETYTIDSVTDTSAGQYAVEVTNPKGLKTTSRAAALTTTAVPIAIGNANLPADVAVPEGIAATFAIEVTGTLPTYQWFREGEAIAGATGPQLTLDSVPFTESGKRFWVEVANRLNTVTSRHALLTVNRDATPPTITAASGGGRTARVTFSEPLDSATAQDPKSYSLDGGVQVQAAAVDAADPASVTLTTGQQTFGQVYTLAAPGVKDRFGNPSSSTALFRSSINIDGNFDDWNSVASALTFDQLNPGTIEFKEMWITNDNDYLYIRFSLYEPAGPLSPADWNSRRQHYDIIIDTDNDPATGTWSGGDLLTEDGGVYRLAGGWTQGMYDNAEVVMEPGETAASDFEYRISRHAKHQTDGLPPFPGKDINIFMVLQTMAWVSLDQTSPQAPYSFTEFEPLPVTPGPLSVSMAAGKVVITWPGTAVLETRSALNTGSWTAVPGAASGYQIDPASANSAYYRLRAQ